MLRKAWTDGGKLQWVHWCGAGVDALLFPELIESGVQGNELARGLRSCDGGIRSRSDHRLREAFPGNLVISDDEAMASSADGQHPGEAGAGRRSRQHRPDHCPAVLAGRDAGVRRREKVRAPTMSTSVSSTPATDWAKRCRTRTSWSSRRRSPRRREDSSSTEQFRLMKPTARIVNVGRGAIIDETALIGALRANEIAGAALDVFEQEPLPEESPLWSMSNVIVSPHMSGDFYASADALARVFLENYRRYCAGRVCSIRSTSTSASSLPNRSARRCEAPDRTGQSSPPQRERTGIRPFSAGGWAPHSWRRPSPDISPISYCGRQFARVSGSYSLKPLRRSVGYAFSVFRSVRPTVTASWRPRDENR